MIEDGSDPRFLHEGLGVIATIESLAHGNKRQTRGNWYLRLASPAGPGEYETSGWLHPILDPSGVVSSDESSAVTGSNKSEQRDG